MDVTLSLVSLIFFFQAQERVGGGGGWLLTFLDFNECNSVCVLCAERGCK